MVAFDELKTDYKNPIDQCNSLNPVSKPLQIYIFRVVFSVIHVLCISTARTSRIHSTYILQLPIFILRPMGGAIHKHTIDRLPH